jgi:hypothetical protein
MFYYIKINKTSRIQAQPFKTVLDNNLTNDGRSVGSRCRRRCIGRSWGISWGWSIDSFTTVLDIGNVASIGISSVGHSLEATIGKSNMVLTLSGIAIAGLRGSKVGTTVAVIDSIGVVVCWGNIRVDWTRSISGNWSWSICWNWSRGVCWDWSRGIGRSRDGILRDSSDGSHQSKQSNEALKIV